ncbi:MAG TPA: FixH family protein [Gaiellales bacterium]|nr:FixH family protein [Gaiellales bacterium]
MLARRLHDASKRLVTVGPPFLGGAALAAGIFAVPRYATESAPERVTVVVGPGPVKRAFPAAARRLELRIEPNRAGAWNALNLKLTKSGVPLHRARITISMTMRNMQMGTQTFPLRETRGGTYSYEGPALVMAGLWDIVLAVAPPGGKPFRVVIRDRLST